jgi:membrane-bound lytic murein transglycosylase D
MKIDLKLNGSIVLLICFFPLLICGQQKDSAGASGDVQFLKLGSDNGNGRQINQESLKRAEESVLVKVKEYYSNALRFWFVEQNLESARNEYDKAIDSLFALGELLSSSETDENNGNGSIKNEEDLLTIDTKDITIDAEDSVSDNRTEYLTWLVNGLIDNYKVMLESNNQYQEQAFTQQVISRLAYYDIGLSGLNTYGEIHAPIVKGHALDYIPLNVDNERVNQYIKNLKIYGAGTLQTLYRKVGRYEHIVRKIAREEGLSEDIIYLGMIESGFNTRVQSQMRATGPWQFMKGTAKMYGLNVDWWVDERKDIYESTRAAVRHLKDLFYEYGDWYLALAAYNSGPGRVNRAIKKNNTRDYWEMTKLPRETKRYVPYFLSAARIAKEPALYGITLEKDSAWTVDTVSIRECLDLQIIADCAGTSVDSVREINPALLRWCTPPTMDRYVLKLPVGTRSRFLEGYAKVPADKKRTWVRYQVKYGETLSLIAGRYGTDIKAIQQANQLKTSTNLITGQYLLIPVAPANYKPVNPNNDDTKIIKKTSNGNQSGSSNLSGASSAGTSTGKDKKKDEKEGKKKISYTVEAGNNLSEIAEWYNVLPQDIRNWNSLYYGDPIYPGQTLTIWVDPYVPDQGYRKAVKKKAKETETIEAGTKVYLVQEGDNLASIAKMFGVEVSTIKRWNKMSTNTVRVGDKLKIYLDKK